MESHNNKYSGAFHVRCTLSFARSEKSEAYDWPAIPIAGTSLRAKLASPFRFMYAARSFFDPIICNRITEI